MPAITPPSAANLERSGKYVRQQRFVIRYLNWPKTIITRPRADVTFHLGECPLWVDSSRSVKLLESNKTHQGVFNPLTVEPPNEAAG